MKTLSRSPSRMNGLNHQPLKRNTNHGKAYPTRCPHCLVVRRYVMKKILVSCFLLLIGCNYKAPTDDKNVSEEYSDPQNCNIILHDINGMSYRMNKMSAKAELLSEDKVQGSKATAKDRLEIDNCATKFLDIASHTEVMAKKYGGLRPSCSNEDVVYIEKAV